jgi:hypothetical protein
MSQLLFCRYPLCPLRKTASDPSEMSSQVFFGEIVEPLETDRQWIKIRCEDQYEGWVDHKFFSEIETERARIWQDMRTHVSEPIHSIFFNKERMILTQGAFTLPNQGEIDIATDNFRFPHPYLPDLSRTERSKTYLNAPYLWGGKSLMGIDCSGLTQLVLAFEGIKISRDAYLQEQEGLDVSFENRQSGDLAYFVNSKGKVTHVGILVDQNQIIHAHGCVRIDKLDKKGIFNPDSQTYSHTFHSVKRYSF